MSTPSITMGFCGGPSLLGFVLLLLVANCGAHIPSSAPLNRSSFPPHFIFGTASSAYQYEGAAKEGGRGPSVWDTFTHSHPEKIKDHSNGDVAVDSYHRYKEDVTIMKELGMDAYRFSISWTRILPYGNLRGGVNKEGITYYNHLINQLFSNGITPFVTLFHWDSPQKLEDDYKGFLSSKIVADFRDYADICFREFGDRVKHWITFNEPLSYCTSGYVDGTSAPGRCSPWLGNCTAGNSATEPYIVAHNQILAHATAVKLYRHKYQANQNGSLGMSFVTPWYLPLSSSKSDKRAVQRALDFSLGWFMDPLANGDYPSSVRSLVGKRLPKFTKEESEMVKGSYDFVGSNYYTTSYVANAHLSNNLRSSYNTDRRLTTTPVRNGIAIGPKAASSWQYVYPQGLHDMLTYVHKRYNNPVIYITENGVSTLNDKSVPRREELKDNFRVNYYQQHLKWLLRSIREGVDVRGYFAWSLLDNFEWSDGYTIRFGIYYVDYEDVLKRYPKKSATWFRRLLTGH